MTLSSPTAASAKNLLPHNEVDAEVVEGHVALLEGLLVAILLPPGHRAKARLAHHQVALSQPAVPVLGFFFFVYLLICLFVYSFIRLSLLSADADTHMSSRINHVKSENLYADRASQRQRQTRAGERSSREAYRRTNKHPASLTTSAGFYQASVVLQRVRLHDMAHGGGGGVCK